MSAAVAPEGQRKRHLLQPLRHPPVLEAQTRRDERRLKVVAESPAEFMGFGWVEGLWSPEQFRKYELPFYKKWVANRAAKSTR